MTKTVTRTYTTTFTRAEVLAFLVNSVVEATTGSRNFKDVATKGIAENCWIEVVTVQALNEAGEIHAEITIRIDWERHQVHLDAGRGTITLRDDLPKEEQLSYLIRQIIQFVKETTQKYGLRTVWSVRYRADVNRATTNTALGLSDMSARKWADGDRIYVIGDIPHVVDELSIDLFVVVPKAVDPDQVQPGPVKHLGAIKWFDTEKGYGFIIPDDPSVIPARYKGRDIFVHYSQLRGEDSPAEGQRVSFLVDPKGVRAVDVEFE